jgi:hypothetical protein
MALYKQTKTFAIGQNYAEGDNDILSLLNEYASLLEMPVNMAGRRLLREVLPDRIAREKRKSKKIA